MPRELLDERKNEGQERLPKCVHHSFLRGWGCWWLGYHCVPSAMPSTVGSGSISSWQQVLKDRMYNHLAGEEIETWKSKMIFLGSQWVSDRAGIWTSIIKPLKSAQRSQFFPREGQTYMQPTKRIWKGGNEKARGWAPVLLSNTSMG